MKVFSRRHIRIIYLGVILFLYLIYTKLTSVFFQSEAPHEFLFSLDKLIPFYPQLAIGYASWILILTTCFIFLYFSAGNTYESYMFALAFSLVLYNIAKMTFSIENVYPMSEDTELIAFLYNNVRTSFFPSVPATLLPTTMFFLVFQKIKHKRVRRTSLQWIFPIIFILWFLSALFSKMAYLPDLLVGFAISFISSLIVCLIRCKSIY